MTLASSGKESGVVLRTWRDMPVCDRGEGIYLFDREGKRYIDGAAGSSVVVNIGHGVKEVAEAMYRQAQKVSFAAPHVFANEPLMALGRLVAEHAPGTMRNNCRTWFTCTGSRSGGPRSVRRGPGSCWWARRCWGGDPRRPHGYRCRNARVAWASSACPWRVSTSRTGRLRLPMAPALPRQARRSHGPRWGAG